MPTPIVAANWKMNKTFDEGRELFEKIRSALHRKEGADVVIIPTFLHLRPIAEQLLWTESYSTRRTELLLRSRRSIHRRDIS